MWVHIKQSYIKRIKGGMLRAAARVLDGTPNWLICTLCWKRLTLTQDRSHSGDNGAFLTTVALAHLRDAHPHVNEASEPRPGMADNKDGRDPESD